MTKIKDYALSGFISGVSGDMLLQYLDSKGLGNSGLHSYFQTRTPMCSVLSAGLLTGFWSGFYAWIYPEQDFFSFGVFAALVDVFYRYNYTWLYPSLQDYYSQNTMMETILYNIGVSGIVYSVELFLGS